MNINSVLGLSLFISQKGEKKDENIFVHVDNWYLHCWLFTWCWINTIECMLFNFGSIGCSDFIYAKKAINKGGKHE